MKPQRNVEKFYRERDLIHEFIKKNQDAKISQIVNHVDIEHRLVKARVDSLVEEGLVYYSSKSPFRCAACTIERKRELPEMDLITKMLATPKLSMLGSFYES